ncbi:MAG: DUF5979 domain-containing protein, partial [Actinomycetota bacterium]
LGDGVGAEVDPFDGHTIVPNPVVLDDDGETVVVIVTNPWPAGKIAIEKVELGNSPPNGTYTFTIAGPETLTVKVNAGETWTSDWLELGTYTITEHDAPAGHTITPNPVVLDDDGETVLVTVTNMTAVASILPETGGADRTGALVAASILLAAGVALVAVAHRRRATHTD